MTPRTLHWLLRLYPPFAFAGIRVLYLAGDWRYAKVRLRRHWYNQNFVGTHFGGNLFSMTDPFWMILVMQCLGRDYIVWDQTGEITFVSAVREDVFAEFRVEESVLDELRTATANGEKRLRWFETEIKTARGEVVARVRKQLYVRRKRDR